MNQKPLAGDPPSSVVPGHALKAARETLYSFILVHGDELENKIREFPTYKIQVPPLPLSPLLYHTPLLTTPHTTTTHHSSRKTDPINF